MKKLITVIVIAAICAGCATEQQPRTEKKDIRVSMETTMGHIGFRLFDQTPLHRDNFVKLVQEHYFDSLLFHRVIENFVVQGGDPNSKYAQPGDILGDGDPGYTVPAEFRVEQGLIHRRGYINAAREGDDVNPEQASCASQFCFMWGPVMDDAALDRAQQRLDESTGGRIKLNEYQREVYRRAGGSPHLDGQYTVFGEVTEGLDVIYNIQKVATDANDRPLEDVRILSEELKSASEMPAGGLLPDETLLLYPEGQYSDAGLAEGPLTGNGLSGVETTAPSGSIGNISDCARIDLYFPENPNGQMIVVCPGGGYQFVSSYNEGLYVADWMLERGVTVCVVKYRLPNGNCRVPLTDVQNAFRYCRANAEKWGVRQIGVMGFSAGGHLAASASTLYGDEATRPDFSLLVYPVITMEEQNTHLGSKHSLIGTAEQVGKTKYEQLEAFWSLENQVSGDTPPTLLFYCEDDDVVPPVNSLRYYDRLVTNNVPAKIVSFPNGGHGWGFSYEKFVGPDKDWFAYAREEFFSTMEQWLKEQREQ